MDERKMTVRMYDEHALDAIELVMRARKKRMPKYLLGFIRDVLKVHAAKIVSAERSNTVADTLSYGTIEEIAFHEAGHAIGARSCGMWVHSITVEDDPKKNIKPMTVVESPYKGEWAAQTAAVQYLCGPMAEEKYTGRPTISGGMGDILEAVTMIEKYIISGDPFMYLPDQKVVIRNKRFREWLAKPPHFYQLSRTQRAKFTRLWKLCVEWAQMEVDKGWHQIEHLAAQLVEQRTLHFSRPAS